jgi:hypothetical protein
VDVSLVAPRAAQNRGDKVMPKRVGGNAADSLIAKGFPYSLFDDIAPRSGRNGQHFIAGAVVVASKEGQGGQRSAGSTVQASAGIDIVFERTQGATGKTHHSFLVALTDDHSPAFLPVDIAAPQPAGFMDAQSRVCQGNQEGPVPQEDKTLTFRFSPQIYKIYTINNQLINIIARELRQAFASAPGAVTD